MAVLVWCHNFWWKQECRAGWLWLRLCPEGTASYWLDWLPAFCAKRRYWYQRQINARGYTVYGTKINS